MSWTKVVTVISDTWEVVFKDEHNLRVILMGSIAVWNLWKISLAIKNVQAARNNQSGSFEPYESAAISESAYVIVQSCADFVIKEVKLTWNFYPYVWNKTGQIGLQGATSRAICYLFVVNVVHQIEEEVVLLILRLVSPRKNHIKTIAAQQLLLFARRLASSGLHAINYSVFRRDVAWALELALKFINLWCIQPLKFLRTQIPDAEVPTSFKLKAIAVEFPEKRIRIGSRREPRAEYGKVFFLDYIIVNEALLNVLKGDEALAIFCRELGHWKLGHAYILNFFAILEFVLGDLLLLWGASKVSGFYRLDADAHIVVHVSLMKYFVQPMLCGLIQGIAGVVNSHLELMADLYACQVLRTHSATILHQGPWWGSLVEALKKLAPADPENYQFFDETFAEFFHGQPTIPRRLSKSGRKLRFSEDIKIK